jgi:hypothetical protein
MQIDSPKEGRLAFAGTHPQKEPVRSNRSLFLVLVLAGISLAQTERFIPDSLAAANQWRISNSAKLYVGASFYYMDPLDSIVVWLDSSEASDTGMLYFMVPGYADSALPLFSNRRNSAAIVNISKTLGKPIPRGTEVFFMYKRQGLSEPKYTGQNRFGKDPSNQTAYPGARFVSKEFGLKPGFGRRFAVAGRLDGSLHSVNDTIVFGFEDGGIKLFPGSDSLISDFDFNDVIFRTTGLALNIEPYPDSLGLSVAETMRAGDSIPCLADVWSDSTGTSVRSPQFDSLVTWKLAGGASSRDTLMRRTSPVGSAVFFSQTAFKQVSLCGSIINPFKGDTIRSCKSVRVVPGAPASLSIELRADTASSSFTLNEPVQIQRTQISSNATSTKLYAIFRDRFGNFAGFSTVTTWDTSSRSTIPGIKAGVAQVSAGDTAKGEGIVRRVNGFGNILVIARSFVGNDTLRDSVTVNVTAVNYDSLRIGVVENGNFISVNALQMTTDQCTTIVTEGKRGDNGIWESLGARWRSTKWPVLVNESRDNFRFCPSDTGIGILSVDYLGELKDTLSLRVTAGTPVSLILFGEKENLFPSDTLAVAGQPLLISARIFDARGVWLKNIGSGAITWKVIEHATMRDAADSSGRISASKGNQVTYVPLRARRIVTLSVAFGGLLDTVAIKITPGKPYRLVIESSANWQATPFAPDEVDTMEIQDDRTTATVWALLRDSLGNFVDSLRNGVWSAADSLVSVRAGGVPGEGQIQKNLSISQGECAIYAAQSNGGLKDTAIVRILPYHYVSLRIVNMSATVLDSLVMSTNDDTLLFAQALRSDTAVWREVSCVWSTAASLVTEPVAPASAQSFQFSPVKAGNGDIVCRLGGKQALADTIHARFTIGTPVRAEIVLITKADALFAGDTLRLAVRIFNRDGLVPGAYCFRSRPAQYLDVIGRAGSLPPKVIVDGAQARIATPVSGGDPITQCFLDGVDTVGVLLFYAPLQKDSLHQLTVMLDTLTAKTAPFRLSPSTLATLALSHTSGCCTDTLVLRYPHESAVVFAVGYDRFGNVRGDEKCGWKTTGSIQPILSSGSVSSIVYGVDSQLVNDDEYGDIVAVAASDPLVFDSLRVWIIGPLAEAVSAVTRDENGNGLLDRIDIGFSIPVFIRDPFLRTRFHVTYQGVDLEIDSIAERADSLHISLFLHESGAALQTDWTPGVSLNNAGFALGGAVDSFSLEAKDGAGPVIASVIRDCSSDDIRNNVVTVSFSEPVIDEKGNAISFLLFPERLFATWLMSENNQYTRQTMLDGIEGLIAPTEVGRVSFKTTNGKVLTIYHYFSLATDSLAPKITDKAGNGPSKLNRKVKVSITGSPSLNLVIARNPSTASRQHESPGEFHLQHNPSALTWVRDDNAGTAFIFRIFVPQGSTMQVGGRCNIFDNMGNLVIGDPKAGYKWSNIYKGGRVIINENNSSILPSSWTPDGTTYEYAIYWNGFARNGRKVAPGVYQVVLTLIIESEKGKETKTLTAMIGMK